MSTQISSPHRRKLPRTGRTGRRPPEGSSVCRNETLLSSGGNEAQRSLLSAYSGAAMTMTERTSKKPRFTRVVKDGKLYLRDRQGFKTVGPFDSWAAALAHFKDQEHSGDAEGARADN